MARDIRTSLHGRRLGLDPDDLLVCAGLVLASYTVATVPSASAASAGAVIFVSNGTAGSPCIAVSDGTNWKVCSVGASIAAA